MEQRGLRSQTGKFKYTRSEVENRIDAGELVEECNADGKQDRFAQTTRPEMRRRCLLRRRSRNLISLGFDLSLGRFGLDALQDLHTSLAIALPAQKPTRAFGNSEAEQSIEK